MALEGVLLRGKAFLSKGDRWRIRARTLRTMSCEFVGALQHGGGIALEERVECDSMSKHYPWTGARENRGLRRAYPGQFRRASRTVHARLHLLRRDSTIPAWQPIALNRPASRFLQRRGTAAGLLGLL